MAKNQCDGCARGLKIYRGAHIDDIGMPVMGCTAELYQDKPHWLSGEEINNLGEPIYKPTNPAEPVWQFKQGWLFWDETWSNAYGFFATTKDCDAELVKYCETL
jgi:hypothetical protein